MGRCRRIPSAAIFLRPRLRRQQYAGLVAACGNAMSAELNVNVFPFILRGVSLLGVDSVEIPACARGRWRGIKLAGEWVSMWAASVTEVRLKN